MSSAAPQDGRHHEEGGEWSRAVWDPFLDPLRHSGGSPAPARGCGGRGALSPSRAGICRHGLGLPGGWGPGVVSAALWQSSVVVLNVQVLVWLHELGPVLVRGVVRW